jgi:hypothetical protein
MMNDESPVELKLEVSIEDASDEELDQMTRQLLAELRETEVESVELARGGSAPQGAKGDPVTLGAIALVALPTFLPKIVEAVQAWALRGQGRTVKFKGKGIEFEGPPEELQKLLAKMDRAKKK